jgi:hypothetical protein
MTFDKCSVRYLCLSSILRKYYVGPTTWTVKLVIRLRTNGLYVHKLLVESCGSHAAHFFVQSPLRLYVACRVLLGYGRLEGFI